MSFGARVVRSVLPLVPRRVMWMVARRYVAGDRVEDALRRVREMRARGFGTILDLLGEQSEVASQAQAAAEEYGRAITSLRGADPGCTISVKPTQLGLTLDEGLCARLLGELCRRAAADGRRVRLEMEDAPTVDATLAVFERLRGRHPNLGCVLQSRLFRSAGDARQLLAGGTGLDVRLVKGIYLEPASIAWTCDEDISRSFVQLAGTLLEGGARVALATHDDALAAGCLEQLKGRSGAYEFQCLLGVRSAFAERLRAAGHPVRIYVPYGPDWHAYSLRRMKKNPQIARAVLRAALRLDR